MDKFGVGRPEMDKLIAAALSRGGDYADLYFEHTSYGELMLRDSQVSSGGFHIDYGVGIRTLKGEKTGYAYSENTQMPDMMAAAKAASLIASSQEGQGLDFHSFCCSKKNDFYPIEESWSRHSCGEFKGFLENLEKAVRAKDERVVKVVAKLSWSESDVMMYNSFGELAADTRPMCSVGLNVIFQKGDMIEQKSASRSFRKGSFMLTGELIETLASEAVKGIDARFEAQRPKGGKMKVVMGAGASGILLHEAMGHAFEADFNRKGQSVFEGRMGQKICSDGINIVDDATLEYGRGSLNYDDEGVSGQKTYMVRDGVLESYLHDRISAAWYGVTPTGNGRREDFRCNPIPRMTSTYMESGDAEPEGIIASVKKGIYVDEFSNGQVKIGEGDFTFYVKSGFLIENGRLTMPVKDINIIGNGPKALSDILAVGNDGIVDNGTWTCGKEQSVPVTCGIPTVLVKSLVVGGE